MRDIHVGDMVDILKEWKSWRAEAITILNRTNNLKVWKVNINPMGTYLYLENPELSAGYMCIRRIRVELSKLKKVRRLQ